MVSKKTQEMFPDVEFKEVTKGDIQGLISQTITNKVVLKRASRLYAFLVKETSLSKFDVAETFGMYLKTEINLQLDLAAYENNAEGVIVKYGFQVSSEPTFPLLERELLNYPKNHRFLAYNIFRENIRPIVVVKHAE